MSKVIRSLVTADFHRSYVMKMKAKGLRPKNRKDYTEIIKTMGQVYTDELLKNGIVQLPWGHGDIYLKNKTKGAVGHYENGKPVILFNDHSEGIGKTFFWLSTERKNKKTKMWCFSAYRNLKRGLAQEIKTKKHIYPDFDKMLNRK